MASPRRERSRTTRVSEMAEFSGVSEQAFRKWMKLPGFPMAKDGSVCLWDLVVWKERLDSGGDSELEAASGGDSPALERMRLARAGLWERELARVDGDLIPFEDANTLILEYGGLIRDATDRIRKLGGDDYADLIEEALREGEARAEQRWGSDRIGPTIVDGELSASESAIPG